MRLLPERVVSAGSDAGCCKTVAAGGHNGTLFAAGSAPSKPPASSHAIGDVRSWRVAPASPCRRRAAGANYLTREESCPYSRTSPVTGSCTCTDAIDAVTRRSSSANWQPICGRTGSSQEPVVSVLTSLSKSARGNLITHSRQGRGHAVWPRCNWPNECTASSGERSANACAWRDDIFTRDRGLSEEMR